MSNRVLHFQFCFCFLQQYFSESGLNEQLLFHGSRSDFYDTILKDGFDHRVGAWEPFLVVCCVSLSRRVYREHGRRYGCGNILFAQFVVQPGLLPSPSQQRSADDARVSSSVWQVGQRRTTHAQTTRWLRVSHLWLPDICPSLKGRFSSTTDGNFAVFDNSVSGSDLVNLKLFFAAVSAVQQAYPEYVVEFQ